MSYQPPPHGRPTMRPYGPPPRRRGSGEALIAALMVSALAVIGVVVGGFFWHQRGSRAHTGPAPAAAGQKIQTSPLTGRRDDELLVVLPEQEDFDKGWTVRTGKGSEPSARPGPQPEMRRGYFPPRCEAPFQPDDTAMVGSVEAALDDKNNMFAQSISVELSRWKSGAKLSRLDEYIAQCAAYVEVAAFSTGEVDTTKMTVKKIDPPGVSTPAQLKAYRQEGTTTSVYPDGRPVETSPFTADDVYLADFRGMLVWTYCGNSDLISRRCQKAFADVLTRLGAL